MGNALPDVALMRAALAALDELVGYTRTNTYDEQPGEADAERRARDVALDLKKYLAAHVVNSVAHQQRELRRYSASGCPSP